MSLLVSDYDGTFSTSNEDYFLQTEAMVITASRLQLNISTQKY